MWFKNLKLFRLNPDWTITAQDLEEKLQANAFVEGSPGQETKLGWVSPLEHSGLVYELGQYYFLTLQAEKKLLPASVINQFAREKAIEIEEQQGYKPGRKQMKEIKEMVTDTLIPKAFSIFRQTRACLDLEKHWLYIDAGTASKADEVISLLVKALDPVPIQSFMTEVSPSTAMTEWIFSDEATEGFNIEPQTEFKSTQEDRATVRFTNVIPSQEEVSKHIESGKVVTKLGLTWRDRVSFVLHDTLEIKRIQALEILDEQRNPTGADDVERFEADMTLMCKEFSAFLDDLTVALGGEKK
ncbi:MAG: recombination-associated protein RdgC [Alcaligenaceae bacterium]|nr:recombination-associated protein RdgC [Alcaligenaceae bacterium]